MTLARKSWRYLCTGSGLPKTRLSEPLFLKHFPGSALTLSSAAPRLEKRSSSRLMRYPG
jgi:hypothetical protein